MQGRWPKVTRRIGFYFLAAIAALPFLFPIWWMVASSLKPAHEIFVSPPSLWPSQVQWSNYVRVFTLAPFARQVWNSLYIALLNVGGVLFLASLSGYGFARIRFRGRTVLFVTLISALLMPAEVTIIPLFRLMSALGWVGTHLPLIVEPWFGPFAALAIFLMRQAFLAIPDELEEAARIDGLGRFGMYRRIGLPLIRPSLATLAILAFINSWNRFLEPLVFLRSLESFTVPLGLAQYVDSSGGPLWEVQLAATTLSVVPVALAFAFAQKYFIAAFATTGLKG